MSPTSFLRRSVPIAVAATLLAPAACTGSGGTGDGAEETAPRLGDVRPDLPVQRDAFCDAIGDHAVERAVGEVAETAHYGNGERAELAEGERRDVAHEFGCSFTGTAGTVVRAWVFVPQVTRKRARELARAVRSNQGCRGVDAQGFGKPGVATVCADDDGVEASWRGLFGGTWFACSLRESGPGETTEKELVQRAGSWCAAAVTAAST